MVVPQGQLASLAHDSLLEAGQITGRKVEGLTLDLLSRIMGDPLR